jgi:hypothetical protein
VTSLRVLLPRRACSYSVLAFAKAVSRSNVEQSSHSASGLRLEVCEEPPAGKGGGALKLKLKVKGWSEGRDPSDIVDS